MQENLQMAGAAPLHTMSERTALPDLLAGGEGLSPLPKNTVHCSSNFGRSPPSFTTTGSLKSPRSACGVTTLYRTYTKYNNILRV